MVSSSVGKLLRLGRIFAGDSKAVIFAMDHGVERGPEVFPVEAVNPRTILKKVVAAGFDAIMVTKGVAASTHEIWQNKLGLILKISGKSELRSKEEQTLQSPFGSVSDAIAIGADAIASTIYWGSKYEDLMLKRFVRILSESEASGMPVLQLAYPRVEGKNNNDMKVVSYAARLAFESGADAIKTYYTGDRESFAQVVKSAGGVPVLLSGGETSDQPLEFLKVVESVMAAGAKGVVVGRNVFQHKDPEKMGRAVIKVVHEEWSADRAAKLLDSN